MVSTFDPLTAAARAVQQVRTGQPLWFEDGPVGDLERDALTEGLPLWLKAKAGHIYLAVNASWPGLFKIGCTRRSVESRMKQLGGAGMATPWVPCQVWEVHDAHGLEARAHKACQKWQVKGELFHAEAEELIAAIDKVIFDDREQLRNELRFFVADWPGL